MEKIKTLSLDLETYSSVSLKKAGVYPYAESPDFEILLFGYSVNGGPVQVVDIACGEQIPEPVLSALTDDTVIKWAFNASFERICLSYWLQRHHPEQFKSYSIPEDSVQNYLNPEAWRCSMVWSAYMGLPLSLEGAGTVLKLDAQKLSEGKDLIRYFCVPCAPTKSNDGRTRNLPENAPDKWSLFKKYNQRDVEVEMAIQQRLHRYPVPDFVWEEYHLDQEINDRGIAIDMSVVENAICLDERSKAELSDKMKSSVKKYTAMQDTLCADGRARGMFQFYGANRSGRWAGRHIQLQNLPQNHLPDLEEARSLVKAGNYDALQLLYEDIPDTLSQLIRTAFVPKEGYKFIVSDFSAIEARVLSFLAGETWRMEVFETGGDIYCASASQMFHVPVKKHGQNAHLRQKGKIAELALGYGGSVGALKAMGALEMGLQEKELQSLVASWREANPKIVQFWWDVDRAVKEAIRLRTEAETHGIRFIYQSAMLFIELPSGRRLSYVKPRIGENQFGGEAITYEGTSSTKKWERIESYGPKIVENITQAISRDILAYAMRTLSHCFIVAHVHDELIIECPKEVSLKTICDQMGRTPPWIEGLTLSADGYETMFYKKD